MKTDKVDHLPVLFSGTRRSAVISRATAIFAEALELRSHDIATADGTLAQDLSPQSTAMEQAFDCRLSRKMLQVIAGLTKADAANLDLANKEFPSDQVIQGHVACDQIPPRIARSKLDKVISAERLDGFSLDQSQLMRRLGFEESALPQRIAVALKTNAGYGASFGDRAHRFFCAVSDVDRFDRSLPHNCSTEASNVVIPNAFRREESAVPIIESRFLASLEMTIC